MTMHMSDQDVTSHIHAFLGFINVSPDLRCDIKV